MCAVVFHGGDKGFAAGGEIGFGDEIVNDRGR